jgi:hypothetical protein
MPIEEGVMIISNRTWKTLQDLAIAALVAAGLLILAACQKEESLEERLDTTPSEASTDLDAEDLDSAEHVVEAYEEARNAGDVGRVTSLLVERLAGESEEAIKEGWKDVKSTRFDLEKVETSDDQNKAWAIGKYTVELEDGTVKEYDRWVFPLYKEDGKWKIDPDGAEEATEEWKDKKNNDE